MEIKVKEAIDRLKALDLVGKDSNERLSAICTAFGDPEFGWTMGACEGLREALIGLLGEYDPADWADEYLAEQGLMRLPKDGHGEVIHVGDELCGYGRPDGGVFCKAMNGYMVFVGEYDECAPKEWMAWDPEKCRHYHKPTVEEILDELEGLRGTGDYESVVMRAAELAGMLRELIGNE